MTTMSRPTASQNDAQTIRDPAEWKTGDEPITAAQRSYIKTMATEAGEKVEDVDQLTKAEASRVIGDLQQETGRGQPKTES